MVSIVRPRRSARRSRQPVAHRYRSKGALCFIHADLPLLRPVEARGHLLLYGMALAKRLTTSGPLDGDTLMALSATIAAALRPA